MTIDIIDPVQNMIEHENWRLYRDELITSLEPQVERVQEILGEDAAMNLEDIIEELRNADDEDEMQYVLSEIMDPWADLYDIFLAQYGENDMNESIH